MTATKPFWCRIKSTVFATLITSAAAGIGYVSYHIISADTINAQQTQDISKTQNELTRLDNKIDSTQPAKVAEQIQSLENNQARLESKIDYNEQVRREQHENLILRQDKMYEILIQIKQNGNPR